MQRVVIVGAGLSGMAVGQALARAGVRVTVLERAVPGAEASSAAAGILAPRVEAHGREPLRSVGIAALEAWEGWLRGLGAAPEAVGFARCGALVLQEERPDVEARWEEEARKLEPLLGSDRAWWLPEEGVVDPRRVLPCLRKALLEAGGEIRSGTKVRAVRAGEVELEDGTLESGEVLVCAGAWTRLVPGVEVPVRPVKGQIVALEGAFPQRVVFGSGGYVVPRPGEAGRCVVGATVEEAGFDKQVTVGGLLHVLQTARRLLPTLEAAALSESWAGLRPGTPDEMPLLGKVQGVWVASGHYRNGVLLAPWTAEALRAAMLDGEALPEAFRPERFAGT